MNARVRAGLLTIGVIAVSAAVWWLAGAVEAWVGLDDLDPLGRVVALFAALAAIDAGLVRWLGHEG